MRVSGPLFKRAYLLSTPLRIGDYAMNLIFSLILFFTHQPVRPDSIVVKALSEVKATPEELSLVVTYMRYESGFQLNPKATSWDAKAHVSCGLLQEPCGFVEGHSVKEQVEYWLREYRAVGLASLDSSRERAEKRKLIAAQALKFAMEEPHE